MAVKSKFYVATTAGWVEANFGGTGSGSFYGVSSESSTARTVKLTNDDGDFKLVTGATVNVKFTSASSTGTMTLNVNNTGVKTIKRNGGDTTEWKAGAIMNLVYDGTDWIISSGTYTHSSYLPLSGGTLTGTLTLPSQTSVWGDTANIAFSSGGKITGNVVGDIGIQGTTGIYFRPTGEATHQINLNSYGLCPVWSKSISLGTSSSYWNDIYGTTIYENGTSLANKYLSQSGGSLTGTLSLVSSVYGTSGCGLDAKNSDIINVNGLRLADTTNTWHEGILFPSFGTSGNWDMLYTQTDGLYFALDQAAGNRSGVRVATMNDINNHTQLGTTITGPSGDAQTVGPFLLANEGSGATSSWIEKGNLLDGYATQTWVTNRIPTVNDATLTIQKNGSSVATFTANASSNVTANITVPTKVSELTNDSGYALKSDITNLFEFKGSLTSINNLPTSVEPGAVYNISSAFTANSSFPNDNGKSFPAGTNVVYVAGDTSNYWEVLGGTYPTATTTTDGLMSSTDKTKLNGIETNANNYSLPSQYSNTILTSYSAKLNKISAPTTSGGTTYGAGASGQILRTNGTTIYWGGLAASDIPALNTSKITSGTFDIGRIPTGTSTTTVALGSHTHSNTTITGPAGSAKNEGPFLLANSGDSTATYWEEKGDLLNGYATQTWVTNQGYTKLTLGATSTTAAAGDHIHSDYLPTTGGTMSGCLNTVENAQALRFRTANTSYTTGFFYGTSGNEALTLAAKNNVTAIQFITGQDPATLNNSSWQSLQPALQIKNNKVAINKTLGNDKSPSYELDVNGTMGATTIYENGSTLANKYQAKGNYAGSSSAGGAATSAVKSDALTYATSNPSSNNSTGLKVVVMASAPSTFRSGYLYIITG